MIHNHNQNTRFRSITDCFYCIVVEEIKIFFNLLIHNNIKKYKIVCVRDYLHSAVNGNHACSKSKSSSLSLYFSTVLLILEESTQVI